MYVQAEIQEGIDRQGIKLPQQAVSRNVRGDPTVMILADGNKAEVRTIETGPAVGSDWIVTGGLKPGDRVIVDGLIKVRPGSLVQPRPASDQDPGQPSTPASKS